MDSALPASRSGAALLGFTAGACAAGLAAYFLVSLNRREEEVIGKWIRMDIAMYRHAPKKKCSFVYGHAPRVHRHLNGYVRGAGLAQGDERSIGYDSHCTCDQDGHPCQAPRWGLRSRCQSASARDHFIFRFPGLLVLTTL